MSRAEQIARAFHEAYERLAPQHGYETRRESAVPWSEVPEQNRSLMIAVVQDLLDGGVLDTSPSHGWETPDDVRKQRSL